MPDPPRRALHPCLEPLCWRLTASGRCALHQRPPAPRPPRGPSHYDTPEWQARRRAVLAARGSVCEDCGQGPRPRDPLDVDHRKPLARGGTDDDANLAVRHHSCHARKTGRFDRTLARDEFGQFA